MQRSQLVFFSSLGAPPTPLKGEKGAPRSLIMKVEELDEVNCAL